MKYSEIISVLSSRAVEFQVHEHGPVQSIGDVINLGLFPLELMLKTVAIRYRGVLILAVVLATRRVHFGKLAKCLGLPRADLSFAPSAEIERVLGVPVGGISPLINACEGTAVFDSEIIQLSKVFCGVGRVDRTLEIMTVELLAFALPKICDIHQMSS